MQKLTKSMHHMKSFISGHGFSLLSVLCVTIITATALWTKQTPAPVSLATPPVINLPASVGLGQTLSDVKDNPATEASPFKWVPPLSVIEILNEFSDTRMTRSASTGLWAVHSAVDLKAETGTPVYAIADGYVASCDTTEEGGNWITIHHEDGYISQYASLQLLGSYQTGDAVRAGSVIGFVGNTCIGEEHSGSHLHLEVLHDGTAINPLTLFTD